MTELRQLFARYTTQLREFISHLPYIPRALAIVWQSSRKWLIAWFVLMLVMSSVPVLTVLLTAQIVDSLAALTPDTITRETTLSAAIPILVLVVIQLLGLLASRFQNLVTFAQSDLIQINVMDSMNKKALELDMSYFETSEYYDQLHIARQESIHRPNELITNLGLLVQNSLTMLGLVGILISYAWWLPILLLVGVFPGFLVALRYNRHNHTWYQKQATKHREKMYYNLVLTQRDSAAEMRLFDAGKHYLRAFMDVSLKLRAERIALFLKKTYGDLVAALISLVFVGIALVWIVNQFLLGIITLGGIVAFYQIFNSGQRAAQAQLHAISMLYETVLFLENLFNFLELQPLIKQPEDPTPAPTPLQQGIEFKHISFTYPTSERKALDNYSMTIPAQKIVAIIGDNGLGKTTLMKLLCRFFDPDEGCITWDGVDIRQIDQRELWDNITILFQFPSRYPESVAKNIRVANLDTPYTDEQLQAAAQAAGADDFIAKLPKQYDTVIGKWFGGEELSGGQWQRLALARAFVRDASIIILDEPTSSMDSWSELAWMNRLKTFAEGRTVIMITHRFTTAMKADLIYLLDETGIAEAGTHDELIAQGGRYAQSWSAQIATPQAT